MPVSVEAKSLLKRADLQICIAKFLDSIRLSSPRIVSPDLIFKPMQFRPSFMRVAVISELSD